MTQEDIENAAREESGRWAPGPVHLQDIYRRDDFEAGFHRGANWRIDSVWHDAREQPQCDIFFIYENVVHAFHVDGVFPSEDEVFVWDDYVKDWGLIRWAYIEDLIPNKDD